MRSIHSIIDKTKPVDQFWQEPRRDADVCISNRDHSRKTVLIFRQLLFRSVQSSSDRSELKDYDELNPFNTNKVNDWPWRTYFLDESNWKSASNRSSETAEGLSIFSVEIDCTLGSDDDQESSTHDDLLYSSAVGRMFGWKERQMSSIHQFRLSIVNLVQTSQKFDVPCCLCCRVMRQSFSEKRITKGQLLSSVLIDCLQRIDVSRNKR